MTSYALHYGNRTTPVAWVRPDATWPGMYRIHWPEGEISDMANLSRACDAARSGVRGLPSHNFLMFAWKKHNPGEDERAQPARQRIKRLDDML